MDAESKGAWTLVAEEATLEGLALILQACQASRGGTDAGDEASNIRAYLFELHEIALAELILRTGKGR